MRPSLVGSGLSLRYSLATYPSELVDEFVILRLRELTRPAQCRVRTQRPKPPPHSAYKTVAYEVKSLCDAFNNYTSLTRANQGEVVESLYERIIDYGAHPNERALMQTLQINEKAEHVEFKVIYLEGNSDQLKLALRSTAQVGVCALSLFRSVYRERFDLLGVTGAWSHREGALKPPPTRNAEAAGGHSPWLAASVKSWCRSSYRNVI